MNDQDFSKYIYPKDEDEDSSGRPGLLSKKIHHIIRAKYFKGMLENNALFLKQVTLWEDPYDAAILKCDTEYDGKTVCLSEKIKEIYGQCWSDKDSECDGLWRVCSDNQRNDVVRITVSVKDLLSAVLASKANNPSRRDFAIGKVSYAPQSNLQNTIIFDPTALGNALGWGAAILFHKRVEFSYESEVRLIYTGLDSDPCVEKSDGICKIPLSNEYAWPRIIEQIQFPPWMRQCKKNYFRKKFSSYGIAQNTIVDSTLYEKFKDPIPVSISKKFP